MVYLLAFGVLLSAVLVYPVVLHKATFSYPGLEGTPNRGFDCKF
jgi:hypothetical protein